MKYLLDTSPYIWLIDNDNRLSATAKSIIEDSDNQIYLSVVSFWEIVIKRSLGKLDFDPTLAQMYQDIETLDITLLAIEQRHLRALEALIYQPNHKDPFDQLLISQAQADNLFLISSDGKFPAYRVYDKMQIPNASFRKHTCDS